jgi:hypothetical protein
MSPAVPEVNAKPVKTTTTKKTSKKAGKKGGSKKNSKKTAGKSKTLQFVIDCGIPVADNVIDTAGLVSILSQHSHIR